MHREKADVRWAWWGALGCFTIAAATGAGYRFGLLRGFPWGLQLADVRHAHSQLMTLIPLTQLWPTAWSGRWALHLAAWTAVAPVVVSLGMLLGAFARKQPHRCATADIEPEHLGV